ncbi:MAG: NAD-dependent DNA ligase LigA [Candidatus Omnitrophota bacterium]|nr:NAD-dependent DNA ligase LigA [Candidatus Omnitrophota bacterium]
MNDEIKKKIEGLRDKIRRNDYLYYALSQPEISDQEYDGLMRQLKNLEGQYPRFKADDSPTVRLSGGILEGFKSLKHKQKMLSLDNTYSFTELKSWEERVRKGLGRAEKVEYVAELKIDGVSANLAYRNGKLSNAGTRGDGETGEDVTQNIKTIRAIPLVLLGKGFPDEIEIRGEVYMDNKDFALLNKEREQEGEALFANPRNAASGSLKLLDTSIVAGRRLNFFAHSLGARSGDGLKAHWEFLAKLKEWGLRINPHSRLCGDFEGLIAYCRAWQEKRTGLTYDIDGVVVKLNSYRQQEALGYTLRSPRWAVAYKFPAHQATTEVLAIKVNVGRTGVITPTAELAPVECAGVTIRHATLHNFDEIKRLNIRKGDRVLIERAGEVIPKVVKVVTHSKGHAFLPPKDCPACAGKVVREKEGDVAFRCINPSCPAQLERGLLHFASRLAMDIEGMGEAVAAQLVSLKLVRDFADIYNLKKEELLRLELFKERKADNLLAAIRTSRTRPLSRLIYGLGIRHIGEKAAFVLAREFRTMNKLAQASPDDFRRIYEVGPVMAEAIADFFSQEESRALIGKLKSAGVNMQEAAAEPAAGSALTGKSIVFTGELKNYSRPRAEEMVRRLGGNATTSVSKNTDFVVAGENPGSKFAKAKGLGVKIIGEKEFSEMAK